MADIAASGGYYIAAASDTIFANSGTLTGSIGVIINGFNLEQLLKKIGVQSQTFKSDKHKDILSPYRPVSDTETKILQNTVINVYNQFINAVMDNRQNRIINDTSTLFDGRIFTGEQALKNGLIDKIGTYNDALEYLWKISGKTGLPVTDSKDGKEFLFKILQNFSQKNNFLSQIKLNNFQTPILYLFKN
jgi:protease-4